MKISLPICKKNISAILDRWLSINNIDQKCSTTHKDFEQLEVDMHVEVNSLAQFF